ncbi:MAG: hypothetical protein VB124_02500, partial [Burkholderia sp.]
HLLEAKNREFSQEPELLTGVLDWLLGINVNRSLARPIYATTPIHVDVACRYPWNVRYQHADGTTEGRTVAE